MPPNPPTIDPAAARAAAPCCGPACSAPSGSASTTCSGSAPCAGRDRRGEAGRRSRTASSIWLAGGPSHIDTFDPKPDAPADVRGEFKPIDTAVPGLKISEVFPKLAKVMDRVTLIRSVTSPEADHDRAAHHLLTGYRPEPGAGLSELRQRRRQDPRDDRGALAALRRRARRADLLVERLPDPGLRPVRRRRRPEPGGLPRPRPDPARPADARPAPTAAGRWSSRSTASPSDVAETPLTTSRDQFADQAYDLLTSSRRPGRVQDRRRAAPRSATRYGRNPFGQSCLLARRLVEAGVSFVTLNDRGPGPARLGHAPAELPDDQEHARPAARPGRLGPARRPRASAACSTSTLVVDDGRVRPDARRSTRTPAATTTAGPTASCSPAAGMPAGPRPRQDRRQGRLARRPARHPGRPRRDDLHRARDRPQLPVRDPRRPADPARRRRPVRSAS